MDRLISEQYLIEHLKACFENGRPMYRPTLDEVSEMIKAIPSADPKTGHWILKHRNINKIEYHTGKDVLTDEIHTVKELIRYETDEPYCVCCGKRAEDISQDYCGYCGAKMD